MNERSSRHTEHGEAMSSLLVETDIPTETDAPGPWSIVPVTIEESGLKVWHVVDSNGHSLLSSTAVNGRGPLLQRRMLERIVAAVNALSPEALALARCVVRHDQMNATSTKRFQASSLLAQHVLMGSEGK
jgi:hypothetical protein